MRPSLRAGWIPWCAVVVLALLAASMLHAATPHTAAQRDCPACKALSSPGVTHETVGPGRPELKLSEFTTLPPSGPVRTSTRYLRPLRAPPESPVL